MIRNLLLTASCSLLIISQARAAAAHEQSEVKIKVYEVNDKGYILGLLATIKAPSLPAAQGEVGTVERLKVEHVTAYRQLQENGNTVCAMRSTFDPANVTYLCGVPDPMELPIIPRQVYDNL